MTAFTEEPNCSDPVVYSYQLVDSDTGVRSPLPSFISNIPAGSRALGILTDQVSDIGTYLIDVTGTVQGLEQKTQFNVIVVPTECLSETVSPDGTLGPIHYDIGSGLQHFEPTWTSSVSVYTCPSRFMVYSI